MEIIKEKILNLHVILSAEDIHIVSSGNKLSLKADLPIYDRYEEDTEVNVMVEMKQVSYD